MPIRPLIPLVCALLLAAPIAAAALTDGESDAKGCFTVASPGSDWRVLEPAELRTLDPDARAGLAGPRGVRVLLRAASSERLDLEACLRETLDGEHLELASTVFVEKTEVAGRRAMRGMMHGRRDGVWMRLHALVFREGPQLYRLVSWGRSDEVPADGSTFEEAATGLRFLEGVTLEDLPSGGSRPDADGPGWRVRQGTYVDAALGLELTPRGPWRVALGKELEALGPDASVGLVDERQGALFGMVAERVPGVDAEIYAERCRRAAAQTGHTTGELAARIAGREITLRLATIPGMPGSPEDTQNTAFGVLVEGDLCVQLSARWPASREQAVARALPQAFASLSIEPEERRRELADQLRNAPSSVDAVGEGWSLRDNVYTDFTHGLRWRAPAGFWEIECGGEATSRAAGAVASLNEREQGLRGWIFAQQAGGLDGASWHAQECVRLLGREPSRAPEPPERLQLGEVEGLVSWGPAADGSPLRLVVATAVRGEQAFRIGFAATPTGAERAAATLLAAVRGLEVSHSPMAPTEMSPGRYDDLRLGFAIESPDPGWLFRERKIGRFGPRSAPAVGVAAGFGGEGGRGVWAAAAWVESDPPDLQAPMGDLVPGALKALAELPDASPTEDGQATFRGRPCRHLAWSDGGRRVELVLVRRGGTTLAFCAAAGPGDPSPRDWLAGFRILD